jgi:hypothetical protein
LSEKNINTQQNTQSQSQYRLATEALSLKKIHNKNPSLAIASILINKLLVTSDYKRVLRQSFLSMDIRDCLKKNNWSDPVIESILWEVHETSIASLPNYRKKFIQKFIHNKLAIKCKTTSILQVQILNL